MPIREAAAAAAVLFIIASPAASQSAEETALVIATGVEAGRTARSQAGGLLIRYEKISDDPLVLKGVRLQESPGFSDTQVRVERSDPCRYVVTTTWEQDHNNEHHDYRGETTIDLTEAGPVAFVRPFPDSSPKGPPGSIDYPAAKLASRITVDGRPMKAPSSQVYYATQERLNAAVAHMRKTYCPGRAN